MYFSVETFIGSWIYTVWSAFAGSDSTRPTIPIALPPNAGAVTGSPSLTETPRGTLARALPPPRPVTATSDVPIRASVTTSGARIALTRDVESLTSVTFPTTNRPTVSTQSEAAAERTYPRTTP